jgi:hypothetical protein
MRGLIGGIFALSAMTAFGAADVAAQSVEVILRNREELELTEQQVQQLDAIRREMVQERTEEMAEMSELRSQLASGLVRESQLMAAREERQEGAQARLEQRRERIDAALTEAQRDEVSTLRRQAARGRMAAAGARGPGQGGRPGLAPGRGAQRGQPGPPGGPRRGGFGPR